MTDALAPPTPPLAASPPPNGAAQRGVTEISTKVVEKLAVRLASEVPGVVDRPLAGLRSALAGGPSTSTTATAEVRRSTTWVTLQLDVAYPSRLCEVVDSVRNHVRDGVERLTGLTTSRLDVTVRHIVVDHPSRPRVL